MDNIEDMMQEEEDKTPAQVHQCTHRAQRDPVHFSFALPTSPMRSPTYHIRIHTRTRILKFTFTTQLQRKAEYERNKKGSINKSDFMEKEACEEVQFEHEC
jgi:hypothetical protein